MLIAFLAGVFGLVVVFLKEIFRFIKQYKGQFIFILFIVLALLTTGILMMKPTEKFNKKVIVLGMDALSPQIMESLMKDGRLPNFSRLAQMGSYEQLATTNPAQSPVAWAAFATGKNSGDNGVFDFIVRDPRDYGLDLVFSKMQRGHPVAPLKAKGFWDYTSARKVHTVVLGCPDTFPPYKVYGKMLSGMGVPDILGTQGTFTFYTSLSIQDRDVGGRVFQIDKAGVMTMNFIGPRIVDLGGRARNALTSFKVTLRDKDRVLVEYAGKKIELEAGHWSDWNEVEFDLGYLRKVKGIYKMYLLEVEPELQLYISPINFDPRRPVFPISYPKDYAREIADKVGLYHTQGMPMDVWGLNEKRLSEKAFLQQMEDVWKERVAIFDLEFGRMKSGVLFSYFDSVDIVQHMFWRYTDIDHPAYEVNEAYGNEIKKWYQRMDDLLGDVLKKLGPDDLLVVLSDHGFGTFKRAVHLNSWLMKNGYLVLNDPLVKSGGELLEDINWDKTKAYAVGFSGIYINRQYREGRGIIKPGKEDVTLKADIVKGLQEWVDDKYKSPVIKKAYLREEIFHGKYTKDAPDIIVGFHVGYRVSWQTAMGGVPEGLIDDNNKKWSGDHLFDPSLVPGVIFVNKKIHSQPVIYDVTPTILKFIGYSDAEIKKFRFDGRPLF